MKIWFGFGSEHSANLVIVGTFKDIDKAIKAEHLLESLRLQASTDEDAGELNTSEFPSKFSNGMLQLLQIENFHWLDYSDPVQYLYEHDVVREGTKVIVKTEEQSFQAYIKPMLRYGAKIEVYSAHDHPGPYGRGR